MAELSVVIVSYNTCDLLARCLSELRIAAQHLVLEIIVVDNGSTDGTREFLAGQLDIQSILNDCNSGFAVANNQGFKLAEAPIILLLNSDAFVTSQTLRRAMRAMQYNPFVGLVGVKILNADGSIQAENGSFPTLWHDIRASIGLNQFERGQKHAPTVSGPVDWVHGACMFARKEAIEAVGGLDERYFMYSEEIDWCHRFWDANWQVWYVPEASAVHVGGSSSRSNDLSRRVALYESRLGLRRHLTGPHSSLLLWLAMLSGLTGRVITRPLLQAVTRREFGNQSATADWQLVRAIARMDPLARKLAS